jgi:hypothetical protein
MHQFCTFLAHPVLVHTTNVFISIQDLDIGPHHSTPLGGTKDNRSQGQHPKDPF